jgi:hypothetical protein
MCGAVYGTGRVVYESGTMEILNDPPEERENDEVSLINLTLMEKLELCRRYKLENPKIC